MVYKKIYRISILFFFVAFVIFFILNPIYKYLKYYLAESEPVNANILVIEGWMPNYALDQAVKEIHRHAYQRVITTGLKYSKKYFNLSEDGYLVFYTKKEKQLSQPAGNHLFEIDAAGSLNGKFSAHFNFYINDSLIADFTADKKKRKYSVRWNGSLSSVDSVMVQFTNDYTDKNHDINLLVKDIIIDKKTVIPYMFNSEYDMYKLDGKKRMKNNYSSLAELARNRLLAKGVDSSLVIAVPGQKTIINRTLKSALAFRNWLRSSKPDVTGINIMSMGTHARRTWMIYEKILNKKYNIGIISVPDNNYNHSSIRKFFKTVRESAGIIYYWFVLIFYK